MKHFERNATLIAAALFGLVLSVGTAHATLVGGNAGLSYPDRGQLDLRNNWSAIDNFGSVMRQWIVPLPVLKSGEYSVWARYRGNGIAPTKCRAISFDTNNVAFDSTGIYVPVTVTAYTWANLGPIDVPTDGALQIECDIPAANGSLRGSLRGINYSPTAP